MGKIDSKSTGGGGFSFEDQVAAYFIAYMLDGGNGISPSFGKIVKIDFQTGPLGWEHDDILLTISSGSNVRRIAISIKSNQQFTSKTAPKDFVEGVWKQILKSTKNPFNGASDSLAIATDPLPPALKTNIDTLISLSKSQTPDLLDTRINTKGFINESGVSLYKSFECPSGLQNLGSKLPGISLSKILHLSFDFQSEQSSSRNEADRILSDVLEKGSSQELWEDLLSLAKDLRPKAGHLTYNDVVERFATKFQFRGHRNLASEIKALAESSQISVDIIKDYVGENTKVNRHELSDIQSKLKQNSVLALVGPSGSGKSSLAKAIYENRRQNNQTSFWINYTAFRSGTLSGLQNAIGVQSIRDLFEYGPNDSLLILDGIDRLYSESELQVLASLFLLLNDLGKQKWKILVTSQTDFWQRISEQIKSDGTIEIVPISGIASDELKTLIEKYPYLRPLFAKENLRGILQNPKYLDIAIRAQGLGANSTSWIGESDLIEAFWEREVTKIGSDINRSAALMKIAEFHADQMLSRMPIVDFTGFPAGTLEGFVKDGMITIQDESISFNHDLYGDWARQRLLISKLQTVYSYLESRLNSPIWQRSIRLLSTHLLDQQDDFIKWNNTIGLFKPHPQSDLLEDLFFDVCIVGNDQLSKLKALKEVLLKDKAAKLTRLLQRFLHLATAPNPEIVNKADEMDISAASAAKYFRVPIYTYWPPIILFLKENLNPENLPLHLVSEICEKWLSYTPEKFPFRLEVAQISFACAEHIFQFKHANHRGYVRDDIDNKCYKAMLLSYKNLPGEIEDLSLKLCGLKEKFHQSAEAEVVRQEPGPNTIFAMTHRKKELVPWPDGPHFEVDRAFREVCLKDGSTLLPMIELNPKLAGRLILSLLIEEPSAWEPLHDDYFRNQDLEIVSERGSFYPPFYFRGPFLVFLRKKPEEALDTIIKLVDFTTERWRQVRTWDAVPPTKLYLPEEHTYEGDSKVYFWHSDCPWCPDPVVSAVMAVEKWLYEQLDEGKDINLWIKQILEKAVSVAFLGVLAAVGKKKPELFATHLKVLFQQPLFGFWEQAHAIEASFSSLISWTSEPVTLINIARDWYNLEHRKQSISDYAKFYLLNYDDMRPFFEEARARWISEDLASGSKHLENLIAQFDPANYTTEKTADDRNYWKYNPPKELLEKNSKILEANQIGQLGLIFPFSCQKLLESAEPLSDEKYYELKKNLNNLKKYFGNSTDLDRHMPNFDDCEAGLASLVMTKAKISSHIVQADYSLSLSVIHRLAAQMTTDKRLIECARDISEQMYDYFVSRALASKVVEGSIDSKDWSAIANILIGPRERPISIFSKLIAKAPSSVVESCAGLVFQHSEGLWRWGLVRRHYEHQKYDTSHTKWGFWKKVSYILCSKIPILRKKIWHELTIFERTILFERWQNSLIESLQTEKYFSWPSWNMIGTDLRFDIYLSEKNEKHLIDISRVAAFFGFLDDKYFDREHSAFWSDVLGYLVNRLNNSKDERGEVKGTPYTSDRWIVDSAVVALSKNPDLDNLWLPMIEIGGLGHYWVDDFLNSLFRCWKKDIISDQHFIALITKIISKCKTLNTWTSNKHGSWFHQQDLWCALVGLDRNTVGFLSGYDQKLKNLETLYLEWFRIIYEKRRCVENFIYFLTLDCSEPMRFSLFNAYLKSIKDLKEIEVYEEGTQESLAQLLNLVWKKHESLIKANNLLTTFQGVLSVLVKLQNQSAIYLAEKITPN